MTPAPDADDPEAFDATIELVRRAKSGDGTALDDVLGRYYPRVHAVVRARLGPELRRHTESSDLVQEAMSEALGAFERFDMKGDDDLIRWLAVLVENRIRDLAKYHRRAKRDAGREVPLAGGGDGDEGGIDPMRSTIGPAGRAERHEMTERLERALAGLDAKYRTVIEQRNTGSSWEEVAGTLGLASAGAARMLHSRARVALMKAVATEADDS